MEFPKDEVKNKIVWTKGADFTDGSPRYTFEDATPPRPMNDFRSLSIQRWSADMHTTPEASVITIMVMCVTTKWNVPKPSDRTILSGRQSRERWNCSICLCSNTPIKN